MDVHIRQHNDIKIIDLVGDLDSNTSNTAYEYIQGQLNPKDRVILNMKDVNYMSSAGIRTLLLLYRAVNNSGGQIVLTDLQGPLRETLDLTGFLEYFDTHDTVDAGIQALK
jgi:anti-sigma B factor antagonist